MTGAELKSRRLSLELTVERLADRFQVEPDLIDAWESAEIACHPFGNIFERAMVDLEGDLVHERLESAPSPVPANTAAQASPDVLAQMEAAKELVAESAKAREQFSAVEV